MDLCIYGCGLEGKFTMKNGFKCCSESWQKCPAKRKEAQERTLKRNYHSKQQTMRRLLAKGEQVCYICGEPAKYITNNSNNPHFCCSSNAQKCPEYSTYIGTQKKNYYNTHPQFKKDMREFISNVQRRPDVIQKKSDAMKVLHAYNDEFKENYREGIKQANQTKSNPAWKKWFGQKISELHKDPEFVKKKVAGLFADFNREEERFYNLLQSIYPGKFLYNWGQKVRVGNFRPDFYHKREKIFIDYMGFWHIRQYKKKGMSRNEYIKDRIRKFERRGCRLLVIWYEEMEDIAGVVRKIQKFIED